MKAIYALLVLFLSINILNAQVTMTYDFGVSPGTATPSGSPSNFSINDLSYGNSNAAVTMLAGTSPSSGYTGSSGGYNAGVSVGSGSFNSATSPYFEFTITPTTGYAIKITSVSFGNYATATGPTAYTIRSSKDSYAGAIATGTINNNASWSLKSHSNLNYTNCEDNAIIIRIYGYDATGSTSKNWRIDDLKVTIQATTYVPDLLISEIADPSDAENGRFVEIYNGSSCPVDLTGWQLRVYNDGAPSSNDINLSGSISSSSFITIAYDQSAFNTLYGFNPTFSNNFVNGDGNDVYELFDGTDVIDVYGEVGVDGTGQPWEYTDSKIDRTDDAKGNTKGNPTFDVNEWSISSAVAEDCTPGSFDAAQDESHLPVNLLTFTGTYSEGAVSLLWSTSSEFNNSHFSVERSLDGIHYEIVGTLAAAGNSNVLREYSYTDLITIESTVYYRLRQTDFNGESTVSKPIEISSKSINDALNAIIISKGNIEIQFNSPMQQDAEVKIFSLDGRLVSASKLTLNRGAGTYNLSTGFAQNGIYIISIQTQNQTFTQKAFLN